MGTRGLKYKSDIVVFSIKLEKRSCHLFDKFTNKFLK